MTHKHQHTPHPHEDTDPWHHHSPEEGVPMPEHGSRVNTPLLALGFILTIVIVVVIGVAVVVYFQHYAAQLRTAHQETMEGAADANAYKESAFASLHAGYTVVDAASGKVSIPLSEAKSKVIAAYGAQ